MEDLEKLARLLRRWRRKQVRTKLKRLADETHFIVALFPRDERMLVASGKYGRSRKNGVLSAK